MSRRSSPGVLGGVLVTIRAMRPRRDAMHAVSHLVGNVGSPRVPTQIVETVIGRVPIVVATFHVGRTRANERHQHQPMDELIRPFAFSPESDLQVPARLPLRSHLTLRDRLRPAVRSDHNTLDASDDSRVRYLIAGKVAYWSPIHLSPSRIERISFPRPSSAPQFPGSSMKPLAASIFACNASRSSR